MRTAARAGFLALLITALVLASAPIAGAADVDKKSKTKSPKEWDERVLPYVEFVEETRNLDFKHPVTARFLSDKKFEKQFRSDAKLTKEEREFEEQLAGELLALGLVGEKIDLGEAQEDLYAEGTVGYYDHEKEELVVRGDDANAVDVRVTIVHELTHALQDQHFDLDALYKKAKEGSEGLALDFLVEGDASTVESAYLDTLSPQEQEEYFALPEDSPEDALPEGVPYVLNIFASAPYSLGPAYVYALDPDGGSTGRDRAFARPPTTEEVLVDPVALEQRQRAVKVADPKLEKGEKKAYEPEQFGALTLYVTLASRIDIRTALEAVTGWGGDRYVGFKKSGHACVRVNVLGDTPPETDQLEAALKVWQAAMPPGAVEVGRSDDVVVFTACEAEGVTEPATETLDRAFYNVMGNRIYLALEFASKMPLGSARCVADFLNTEFEASAAIAAAASEERETTDAEAELISSAYADALKACGVAPPA